MKEQSAIEILDCTGVMAYCRTCDQIIYQSPVADFITFQVAIDRQEDHANFWLEPHEVVIADFTKEKPI